MTIKGLITMVVLITILMSIGYRAGELHGIHRGLHMNKTVEE